MRKKSFVHWICCLTLCHTAVLYSTCAEAGDARSETNATADAIAQSLIFHAPFDESFDARVGRDKKLYTAASLERKSLVAGNDRSEVVLVKDGGKYGGALRFQDNSEKVTLFQGVNSSYQQKNWSGTLSFWLKVDPDKGLKPGYCDPIQMTDKTWNDSSMFVDFDKDLPRTFRLGVFSEYRFWNPKDTAWEQIKPEQRPMVVVQQPPFTSDQWTHIAWTFHNINPDNNEKSNAVLYVNGVSQGELNAPMKFVWKPENAVIMLGIAYIGDFDDFSIFDRALTADEIQTLMNLPKGAGQLKQDQ